MPFEPKPHHTTGSPAWRPGFPLAIYLFIGWENSAALAEETGNPRRNVPRAVFLSIAMMGVGYVLFAYATVTGFHYNGAALAAAPIPFITGRPQRRWPAFAVFAYLAGPDLHPGRAHLGDQLPGPADLQRRPGAAAAVAGSARCTRPARPR